MCVCVRRMPCSSSSSAGRCRDVLSFWFSSARTTSSNASLYNSSFIFLLSSNSFLTAFVILLSLRTSHPISVFLSDTCSSLWQNVSAITTRCHLVHFLIRNLSLSPPLFSCVTFIVVAQMYCICWMLDVLHLLHHSLWLITAILTVIC